MEDGGWRCILVVCLTHFDVGFGQLSGLLHHEFVEVWMETVNGTVDADRHGLLVHFVEKRRQTGGHQMRRPPGHALADVPDVGAVDQRRVVDAHLAQDFQRFFVVGFVAKTQKYNQCDVQQRPHNN